MHQRFSIFRRCGFIHEDEGPAELVLEIVWSWRAAMDVTPDK